LRVTLYHLLPTTEVLVAKLGGEIISTLSLIADGYLGLPMQSMYTKEINQLREEGLRPAEVGCLADRRQSPIRFFEMFSHLARVLVQVAHARDIDALVIATHPRHARLYRRAFGFEELGEVTDCPYAQGNPAIALIWRFSEQQGTQLWDQFFKDPLPGKELAPYRWERSTREYFREILRRDRAIVSAACVEGGLNSAAISGVLTT
jgi:hypothetical protein